MKQSQAGYTQNEKRLLIDSGKDSLKCFVQYRGYGKPFGTTCCS